MSRAWKLANPELVAASAKRYYERHKGQLLAQQQVYRAENREDILTRRKKVRDENPELHREYALKSRHGMTSVDYEAMLSSQDGKCAICGTDQPGGHGTYFSIDHDHSHCSAIKSCTVCRRGLLCSSCNLALGYLADRTDLLENAIEYLRTYAAR